MDIVSVSRVLHFTAGWLACEYMRSSAAADGGVVWHIMYEMHTRDAFLVHTQSSQLTRKRQLCEKWKVVVVFYHQRLGTGNVRRENLPLHRLKIIREWWRQFITKQECDNEDMVSGGVGGLGYSVHVF